jgi:hypothetical protein
MCAKVRRQVIANVAIDGTEDADLGARCLAPVPCTPRGGFRRGVRCAAMYDFLQMLAPHHAAPRAGRRGLGIAGRRRPRVRGREDPLPARPATCRLRRDMREPPCTHSARKYSPSLSLVGTSSTHAYFARPTRHRCRSVRAPARLDDLAHPATSGESISTSSSTRPVSRSNPPRPDRDKHRAHHAHQRIEPRGAEVETAQQGALRALKWRVRQRAGRAHVEVGCFRVRDHDRGVRVRSHHALQIHRGPTAMTITVVMDSLG